MKPSASVNYHSFLTLAIYAALMGIGAALFMDGAGVLLHFAFDTPIRSYQMVGRWVGHMPEGIFTHGSISNSAAITAENLLGWITHIVVAVIFAGLFLLTVGRAYVIRPRVFPALMFGIATVLFPFFVLQPALGAGIAASNLDNASVARLLSLIGHSFFGLGLYVSGRVIAWLTFRDTGSGSRTQ